MSVEAAGGDAAGGDAAGVAGFVGATLGARVAGHHGFVGQVAEALADGLVEPLEEARPVDDMAGPVRALYRNWKTDRIGALAARYVDAACEPTQSAI